MSILNRQNSATELTLEQKKQKVSDRILNLSSQAYQQLLQIQRQGIDIVWNNPQGLTPQEVCDGLGNNASKIFEFHGNLTEFIAGMETADGIDSKISLPVKNFTKNPDGTVTILETPYGS